MTFKSPRSLQSLASSLLRNYRLKFILTLLMALVNGAAYGQAPTVTTLQISSNTIQYQSPVILAATVTAGGSPVSTGLVMFCDATAKYCESNTAMAMVQLTSSKAIAIVKFGSGPLGAHSYKAVYRANTLYASSTSNTEAYTVVGTYGSTIGLTSTGAAGAYTLQGSVTGIGSLVAGPTGTISFLDTSVGNNSLGTEGLGTAALSTAFATAANSPFPIGDATTTKSVAIASAYLHYFSNNLDIVTGDGDSVITVLQGNGDGTFQPKVNYTGCTTGGTVKMLLADFNRDGLTDLALACSDGGTNGGLAVLMGNSDGSFQTPAFYSTGDAEGMAFGDFNNDGLLDIALTNRSQQNVVLFLGKGDGTFTEKTTILAKSGGGTSVLSTAMRVHDVVVGDFDGDGNDDIAYSVSQSNANTNFYSNLYVATGKGNGTFNTPTIAATNIGEFLTEGDLNADNKPDIVSCTITRPPDGKTYVGNTMFVVMGNGDGTFATPVAYPADYPSDPHLADVNGDGKPDIIAGGSYGPLVFQGNGDGTFQPYTEPIIGKFKLTYAVNAGDFNNDGNADLVGTNAEAAQAAVSLSQVQQGASAAALGGVAVFPLGSGVHNVDASYSGDHIYAPNVSSTIQLLAAPTPTTLTLTVQPTSATVPGQSVTLTAMLSPYTVGPPTTTTDTETVNFYNGSTLIGSGTLTSGVATLTTTALPAGTDALKAVYTPPSTDQNYLGSTSNTVSVTVTGIVVSSSVNPSTYSQNVTFTATVATGDTGSVTFMDGTTSLGTATLSGTTATLSVSTLTVNSHSITAVYSGDGSHGPATSPVLTQVVNKATPTVKVTTTGGGSYGDSVTITATVTAGTTGTVTFTSGGVTLGSASVNGSGIASITTTALATGNDTITASYPGDDNYNAASGSTTLTVSTKGITPVLTSSSNPAVPGSSVTFTDTFPAGVTGSVVFTSGGTTIGTSSVTNGVATASTSTLPLGPNTITAFYSGDTNYSAAISTLTETIAKLTPVVSVTTSGPSAYGSPVTITASVPAGPTGTITITSGGVTLGSGTITATVGTVTITTSVLPVGDDLITASYPGDTTNNPASGTVTQTVGKAPTATTVTASGGSTYGGSVSLTATVTNGGVGAITGTVTFTSNGVTLGSGSVGAGGVATSSTTVLPTGGNTITATYGGDTNNSGSSGTVSQTVSKAATTVNVSATGAGAYGSTVTITATLPAGPTGTVTFTSGGVTLGTGTVGSTGVATLTTTALPAGSDTITANYGGDTNYSPASGTTSVTMTKASPTMSLGSSPNPSTYGQSVTLTATLPTNATGTVNFAFGATTLGTGNVTNGVATLSTTTLPVGSDGITATYNGDANNSTAVATENQTVNKGTPTVTVTAPATSTYGSSVTITASVPTGVTGSVTITSGGVTLGSGTFSAGSSTVTVTTSTLPVGGDTITAYYVGDGNNNPATGSTTITVSKGTPTVTVTVPGQSTFGDPVTVTVTVPTGATGTITITSGGVTLGSGTVSAGSPTVTVTTSTLPVGSDTITATYSGDNNYSQATGTAIQVVSKKAPTVGIASSLNPSAFNQSVTFTATVPSSVTGTITFYDGSTSLGNATLANGTASLATSTLSTGSHTITASYGGDANNGSATSAPLIQTVNKQDPVLPAPVVSSPSIPLGGSETITETVPPGVSGPVTFSDGGTVIGTAPVVGGVATITVTTLPVGSDPITASTPGDVNNNPATSPATIVTVGKGTPTIALASSVNPSTYGQPVTFTASVTTGATGAVTFMDGATALGTRTLTNGQASITVSTLAVGTHPITASYAGDSSYLAATSAALNQMVNKGTPVLPPPVVSSPSIPYGGSETITETVPPGVTGPVTFTDGGTVIGTAPIVNGTATITITTLPVGSDPITASTPGDTNNNPATSPVTVVTVGKMIPTVGLTSSANPSSVTQSVTFTATVPAAASGTVTFLDGATVLGTGAVSASGVATFTTANLTVGTHSITAAYGGNDNYQAATSAPLAQVVGKAPTTITLTESLPTELLGTTVTFTATVAAGSPTPTGTVSFLDGTTVLGTAPLSTNGTVISFVLSGNAGYATNALTTGTHTITATYSGDNGFATSTSAPVTNIVQDFTVTVTGVKTQNIFPGDTTSYTFNLTPVGSTTFMGNVTLDIDGLPKGTTYTFSPATVAAGSGTTAVTLNVTTSNSLSASNRVPAGRPMHQRGAPIALGMLGLIGLGAARKHRRRMPRMLMVLLLFLGTLLPVAALSGCAGGYFTLTPTTYSVTATGTEGTIQHSATATLVVQ
jgi:hypothetical protein